MIEALTEFEKQVRQKEQARHSNLLQQLRAELAAASLRGLDRTERLKAGKRLTLR
jgi:hypothetical protein